MKHMCSGLLLLKPHLGNKNISFSGIILELFFSKWEDMIETKIWRLQIKSKECQKAASCTAPTTCHHQIITLQTEIKMQRKQGHVFYLWSEIPGLTALPCRELKARPLKRLVTGEIKKRVSRERPPSPGQVGAGSISERWHTVTLWIWSVSTGLWFECLGPRWWSYLWGLRKL